MDSLAEDERQSLSTSHMAYMDPVCPMSWLPRDVLVYLVSHIDLPSATSLFQCSQFLHRISLVPAAWEAIYLNTFGTCHVRRRFVEMFKDDLVELERHVLLCEDGVTQRTREIPGGFALCPWRWMCRARYLAVTTREAPAVPQVASQQDHVDVQAVPPDEEAVQVTGKPNTTFNDVVSGVGRWSSDSRSDAPQSFFEGLWIDGVIVLGLYAQRENRDCATEMYIYGGQLKDKRGCGLGVTVFPTGGIYEGEFLNGELHGTGTLEYKEGDIYKGSWKHNLKHGRGEYFWSSGNTYVGPWIENRREGPNGTLVWSNGDEFCGDWLDNRRTGNGVLRWSSVRGGGVYEGSFLDNMLHGHGKFSFRGLVYDGPWLEDRREGVGTLTWTEDGSYYQGAWKKGARSGKGFLHLPSGEKIEQEWDEPENIKYSQCTPLKFCKQVTSDNDSRIA